MTQKFHELLLSELRMVSYQPGNPADLTDGLLCEAVTMNENLRSLGFTLRPDDLIRLAVSPSLEGIYPALRALIPDVKARPMYPGFPQQVMEMEEAEFRFHQMTHYFSTYGMAALSGRDVSRGWLPEYTGPERTVNDTVLMECRVIELVCEQEAPAAVLKALLNRRERLTNPELELVRECAPLCDAEQLRDIKVRFKENLELLFPLLMGIADRKAALLTLHAVCAHTGDVFRCAKDYLGTKRWHLTTGEKKLLVRLLESYTAADLQRNMMQSLRLRERNLLVLQHLDYNRFSRNAAHRESVRALRAGELLSWFGVGEKMLREQNPEALAYFSRRPGYMLRMINRLLSLHYSQDAVEEVLLPAAGSISGHLVVKAIRTLMKRKSHVELRYAGKVDECLQKYRKEERTPAPVYDRFCESLKTQARAKRGTAEQMLLKQPLREARIQAYREAERLHENYAARNAELQRWKQVLRRITDWPQISRDVWLRKNANADLSDDLYVLFYRESPESLQETIKPLETEVAFLKAQSDTARAEGDRVYRELEAGIRKRYEDELRTVDAWEQEQQRCLENDFARAAARYREAMRTLPARQAAELAGLKKQHDAELRIIQYDGQAVEIMLKLLKEHFRQAVTPLKGKKVFLDLDQFDLEHSTLETEDRSMDGGYIRSGISYRIPQNARYVRFFVYWNDRKRVDVDLHAAGKTSDGQPLHVGWNADFCNTGVVFSGDITHSNAAEYIDIDLSAPVSEIYANVSLFAGRPSFQQIETCYVGLMAVDRLGQDVRHYNPANCFFTHALTQKTNSLFYGYIDVQERFVRFIGRPNRNGWHDWAGRPEIEAPGDLFSLKMYLDCLMESQSALYTQERSEADVVLTMGKSLDRDALSLVDNNFFLEC